jgi:hypothetical protein
VKLAIRPIGDHPLRVPSKRLIYLSIFLLLPEAQAIPSAICPLPMFAAARSFSAPGTSWFTATADFNNDGQAGVNFSWKVKNGTFPDPPPRRSRPEFR